jgi:uncharacterized membrane protein YhaH (DUF805 family)
MSLGTAIATSFRKYSNFTDTATRSEFWWFNLFLVLVFLGLSALWQPLGFVWSLAMVVPYLAVGVRRLRDAGLPWGLIFIGLVPFIGTIVMIVLWVQPSVKPGQATVAAAN